MLVDQSGGRLLLQCHVSRTVRKTGEPVTASPLAPSLLARPVDLIRYCLYQGLNIGTVMQDSDFAVT